MRETNIIRDNPCHPWAKNQSFGVAASAGVATRSLRSLREKKLIGLGSLRSSAASA